MDAGQELVLIDTNVFVIDLRYHRDPNYAQNHLFLEGIELSDRGFTTLVNLFELCGILSFNLNREQLNDLWVHFSRKYGISVLPAPDFETQCPVVEQKRVFELVASRTSFGDALMVATAERYLPFVPTLVTWDKEHLQGIFKGGVFTPQEYLARK